MNQRAQDLGMTNTHFSDPNGLGDENHYASALDMAKRWGGLPAKSHGGRSIPLATLDQLPWRGGSSPTTISSCGSMRAAPA